MSLVFLTHTLVFSINYVGFFSDNHFSKTLIRREKEGNPSDFCYLASSLQNPVRQAFLAPIYR